MGKHFTLIKKKTRLFALVAAGALGLGVGVLVSSVSVLILKLMGQPASLWCYLAGAIAALVSAAVSALLFVPNDKRLAKRLDEEHALGEKIRTMVEFKDSSDEFVKLQREDADERLGRTRVAAWRKKQFIAAALAIVLSLGSLTGAILVPNAADEKPIDEFDKQLIIGKLMGLIQDTQGAYMIESVKEHTVEGLNSLVEFVKTHDYMSEMKQEAIELILDVNGRLFDVITAPRIGEKLAGSATADLVEIGNAISKLSGGNAKKLLEALEESLEAADPTEANFIADELISAIDGAEVDKNEELALLILNFASALKRYSEDDISLEDAFKNVPAKVSTSLSLQNATNMAIRNVTSVLCEIFGISPDELSKLEGGESIDTRPPSVGEGEGEEPPDDVKDPDTDISGGSIGSGDRVYGSNDVIYNPYTDEYVEYGKILDEYNAKTTDKIIDGRITPEFVKFIEEYFKQLSEYKPPVEE